MTIFNEQLCEECPSNCNTNGGTFQVRRFARGETIDHSMLRNHMLFVQTGKLCVRSKSIGEFVCDAQKIILLVEYSRYQIEALEDSEILSLDFHRSIQTCDMVHINDLRTTLSDYSYRFHSLDMVPEMKTFVVSTIGYLRNEVHCAHIHRAKQMELLVVCRYFYSTDEIVKFFYPIVNKDISFESLVKSNCFEARSVEQLAKLCGYGLNTFKKLFDRHFNESPYQWMLQQNAQRIRTMLLDKNMPIKVIVVEFRFSSQSHLNLFCKKRWGCTAKQLRLKPDVFESPSG